MKEEESKFTEALQNVCVAISFTNLSQCMIPWIHALTCDASHMLVVETGCGVRLHEFQLEERVHIQSVKLCKYGSYTYSL